MPNFDEKGEINLLLSKFKFLCDGNNSPLEESEFLELIDFYINKNEIKNALNVFSYANEIYPDSFDLKIAEAQLLIESGLHNAATKKLKDLYKQEPNDLSLLMLIGLNYSQSGLINKAISFFEKATNLVPRKDQALFMFSIAQTFINSGRYDIAIFYLNNARRLNPDDDQILLDLAYCLERSNKFTYSEKLYQIYLKKNPFSKIAWYNLGVVLYNLKKYEKALKTYNYAIAIDPGFSSAYLNKANIYFEQKDYRNAILFFNNVIEIEPENSTAIFMRGLSFYFLNEYKLAEIDIKKSLKINEKNHEAWFYLAKIYKHFSHKRAKKALNKALKLNNLKSDYWNFAARIFSSEKNFRLADLAYMHSISFDPFVDKYWFEYSDFKKKIKDFNDAVSILKMGKDFIKDRLNFYLRICSLYLSIGDNTRALISFKSALKIDPNALNKIIKLHSDKEQLEFLINSKI